MGEQLKPCPFCGGEGEFVSGIQCASSLGGPWMPHIRCKSCGARAYSDTEYSKPYFRAVERWNTRSSAASPLREEMVEAMLHRLRGHASGLRVNARYDPAKPSGLTNADAVSYAGFLDEAADLIEGLALIPSGAEAVPQRWQLVPIEPTQEMVSVGDETFCRAAWKCMLSAAPKAPASNLQKTQIASPLAEGES
jgi:hypothetical protein